MVFDAGSLAVGGPAHAAGNACLVDPVRVVEVVRLDPGEVRDVSDKVCAVEVVPGERKEGGGGGGFVAEDLPGAGTKADCIGC